MHRKAVLDLAVETFGGMNGFTHKLWSVDTQELFSG
jgi:hypothetical protein